jgi:hypothetical protein
MPSSGVWRRVDVVDHAGSSLADFSTLKMEAIRSSETSIQSTTSTRLHTPEDGILHSHRRENLKSYIYPIVRITGFLDFFHHPVF